MRASRQIRSRSWLWLWLMLAALAGAIFTQWGIPHFVRPKAFSHVELVQDEIIRPHLFLKFNWYKEGCILSEVIIVGSIIGTTQLLNFENADPNGAKFNNRTIGDQTIHYKIFISDRSFDWVDIRVRHLCDKEEVTSLFYRWTPTITGEKQ